MSMTTYKGYTIEPLTPRSAKGQHPGGHRILNPDGSIAHETMTAPSFRTKQEAEEYAEGEARAWIDDH